MASGPCASAAARTAKVLALPPAALALARWDARVRRTLLIARLLLSPVLRARTYGKLARRGSFGWFFAHFYKPTHLRLDGIAVGVGLAGMSAGPTPAYRWLQRHALGSATFGAALVLATLAAQAVATARLGEASRMTLPSAVPSFFVVAVGTGLMIPRVVAPLARRPLPGASAVAEHAYALYLTHRIAPNHLEPPAAALAATYGIALAFPVRAALGTAIAAGLAVLLRRLVERPGLRLREHWNGRTSPSAS